ncbi:MAG: CopD family protein [Geminicoccaceae bacterium]
MILGLVLHILGAIIWVGGMFFAYLVLRPAAGALEGQARLALWQGVLGRFFPWVFASVIALLLSGYFMLFHGLGGFARAGVHVHIMQLLGWIMILLFLHLYFAPWRRFRQALGRGDHAEAARRLGQIRLVVAINLALGLLVSAIGASGRYWG